MSTVEGRTMKITVNGQNLERVKQFCYLVSLVTQLTEDCVSCHEVRRRIALGKRGFQQEKWPHARIPQPSLEETYGESICLECCIVWKRNMDSTKRRYSTTRGIWNMDLEAFDESTMDWAQNKWRYCRWLRQKEK